MTQVTLQLEDEIANRLKEAAKAAGLSESQWVEEMVRCGTMMAWRESVQKLAGSWKDFPEAEDLRAGQGTDVPREPF